MTCTFSALVRTAAYFQRWLRHLHNSSSLVTIKSLTPIRHRLSIVAALRRKWRFFAETKPNTEREGFYLSLPSHALQIHNVVYPTCPFCPLLEAFELFGKFIAILACFAIFFFVGLCCVDFSFWVCLFFCGNACSMIFFGVSFFFDWNWKKLDDGIYVIMFCFGNFGIKSL